MRAEFDRLYPFHCLRHSAVTNVYRATRDLFLAQRFARHVSPLTTTVYTHPSDEDTKKLEIETRFDEIFTQQTDFITLNLALKRLHKNKQELLLVLERPDIPLHNNLSENDIREYVNKRKISG